MTQTSTLTVTGNRSLQKQCQIYYVEQSVHDQRLARLLECQKVLDFIFRKKKNNLENYKNNLENFSNVLFLQ